MGAATKIKENADDILADSKKINEERAAAEEVIEACSRRNCLIMKCKIMHESEGRLRIGPRRAG